jgi:hypothetical protein
MNNDITLLFQGRINEQLFNMLDLYKDKYNIIISTNDINNILFNKIHNYLNDHILLITYNTNLSKISKFLEKFKFNFFNNLEYIILKIINRIYKNDKKLINMYYQTLSTYYGLLNVKTKFVIKFRCDEYYSNIEPLVNNMLLNENKIIISDVFIINNYLFPFAISDHIICGKTNLLLKSFNILKLYFESDESILVKYNILNNIFIVSFEQLLGIVILLELGYKLNFDTSYIHDLMYKNFIIVKVSNLGNFVISSNIYNINLKNDESFNKGINSLILTKDFEYMNKKNNNYINYTLVIKLIIWIIIIYFIILFLKKLRLNRLY